MGYHTGGVWPHDNALIAEGFAHYGLTDEASLILESFFEASLHFDLQRIPELFCGFERQSAEGPVPYPLACAPQAWAAGAVLLFVKASLGLQIDALQRQVTFTNPRVPAWLDAVSTSTSRCKAPPLDLFIGRQQDRVSVSVPRNDGSVRVVLR